jgi:hypothetical protein
VYNRYRGERSVESEIAGLGGNGTEHHDPADFAQMHVANALKKIDCIAILSFE